MPSNYLYAASPGSVAADSLAQLAQMLLGMSENKRTEKRRQEDITRAERYHTEETGFRNREFNAAEDAGARLPVVDNLLAVLPLKPLQGAGFGLA